MKTTTLLFTLLLIASANSLNAQTKVVSGRVSDRSENPIRDAIVNWNKQTVRTDSTGHFQFQTNDFPGQLTVQHFSYLTLQQSILRPKADSVFLELVLKDQIGQIEEVVIESDNLSLAYRRKKTHIIDYQLGEKNILLLCIEHGDFFLRQTNEFSMTLNECKIRKNPECFFKDCMQNLYVQYKDSAYLVATDGRSFYLKDPISSNAIHDLLIPCALNDEYRFFFCKYTNYNQSLQYTLTDTLLHQTSLFYEVSDVNYAAGVDEYADTQRAVLRTGHVMGENSPVHQQALRRAADNLHFAETSLSNPLYVPIFQLNDSILIFDHFLNLVSVYNKQSERVRSFPIQYHQRKDWVKTLYLDQTATRVFAAYNNFGIVSLAELDPSNGKILRETLIENHIHPKMIQIRGNYIYYINHVIGDNSINQLYRQIIR
jgi:hypothetical protein